MGMLMKSDQSIFIKNLEGHLRLFEELKDLEGCVSNAIELITMALKNGNKLMICGNGGSAADSQHIAAEFTGRFVKDREPIAAMALSTDSSAITCIGNDYSFSDIFSRQVRGLGRSGDCIIGISTSGNSENVVKAVQDAGQMRIKSIGLIGRDGGKLASICDCSIVVPSNITARIQEAHILLGHSICGGIELAMGMVDLQ